MASPLTIAQARPEPAVRDTQEFAQIIEIYTPPGMEQKFAAASDAAIAGGKSFADADDYATSRTS